MLELLLFIDCGHGLVSIWRQRVCIGVVGSRLNNDSVTLWDTQCTENRRRMLGRNLGESDGMHYRRPSVVVVCELIDLADLADLGVFFLGGLSGLGLFGVVRGARPEHVIGDFFVAVFTQFQHIFE